MRAVDTKGEKNASWKGGRRIEHGYVMVRIDGVDHREHRLVMERHIGRKLVRGEVVHHVNGDKADNRIENLELMTTSEHMRLHGRERSALSEDDVREMRRRYFAGEATQVAIAKELGMHPKHVGMIIRGQKWKHVD